MRRLWLATLLLGGCSVPRLEPALVTVGAAPGVFAQVCAVVRARYPRLLVVDAAGRRVQSAWTDVQHGDSVGRRRATLYWHDDARLALVVEVSWLHMALDGTPFWTRAAIDRDGERELIDALQVALAPLASEPARN